jgi:hypothetical protein
MIFFGPLSSVFDIYTFMVQYYFFKWQGNSSDPAEAALQISKFQTGIKSKFKMLYVSQTNMFLQ